MKEPNVAEFILALAGVSKKKKMVMACATSAGSTTLALVVAVNQISGG